MSEGGRTIVASNREPVMFPRSESGRRAHSRRARRSPVTTLNAVRVASAESDEVSRKVLPCEVEECREQHG